MRVDVVMPQMGESIAEGTITRWMKQIGDTVSRDEPLSRRRIAGDHRARVHAGANRQADAPAALEFVVQDSLRPLHVRGSADGA